MHVLHYTVSSFYSSKGQPSITSKFRTHFHSIPSRLSIDFTLSVHKKMLTRLAVNFLIIYAIFSICLTLPIVYAAFFGHFKGYDTFFVKNDRWMVLGLILVQICASVGIAVSAVKNKTKALLGGLIYLVVAITCSFSNLYWMIFDAFDCDETECEFYGFSMLVYFSTGDLNFEI